MPVQPRFIPQGAIGQLVPSSNRTVERTVEALLAGYPDWGACYARIPFHPDGTGQPAQGYDLPPIQAAVELLRDAGVAAISWNGTKGCWDGFQVDRDLGAATTDTDRVTVKQASGEKLGALLKATGVGTERCWFRKVLAAAKP